MSTVDTKECLVIEKVCTDDLPLKSAIDTFLDPFSLLRPAFLSPSLTLTGNGAHQYCPQGRSPQLCWTLPEPPEQIPKEGGQVETEARDGGKDLTEAIRPATSDVPNPCLA